MNAVERFRKCRKWAIIQRFGAGGQFLGNSRYYNFSGPMYASLYNTLLSRTSVSRYKARELAKYMVWQTANESGYGSSPLSIHYNYGGMKNGGNGWQHFTSMDDFSERFITNLQKKFPNFEKANTYEEYMNALFDDKYQYDPVKGKEQYSNDILGVSKRVNENIDQYISNNPDFYRQLHPRERFNINIMPAVNDATYIDTKKFQIGASRYLPLEKAK